MRKRMINKKRLGALLLAGVMMMGMSTTAFAQEGKVPTVANGTEVEPAAVSITKDFEMAEGLAIPNVTFNFTVAKVTEDAPKATIAPVEYKNTDNKGPVNNGKYVISKESAIQFEAFKHAGEYLYTVTEQKENAEGVTYSTEKYTLRVQVANGEKGLFVKNITAEKGTDNGTLGNKVNKILFTNTYRKNSSLIIEKHTVGELADKTKDFEFTITFTKSATETQETPTYTGKIGEETVTVTAGQPKTFYLHDGEKLVFENLPAGTKYVVTEKGVKDGYTASVKVTDNGTSGTVSNGTDEQDLSSSAQGNYIGENENKVEFTNTYHDIPLTGIIMNNLPFILLIGVAVLAFGTLAFVKRRRTSER